MKFTATDLRVIRLKRKFWRTLAILIPFGAGLWTVLMMLFYR